MLVVVWFSEPGRGNGDSAQKSNTEINVSAAQGDVDPSPPTSRTMAEAGVGDGVNHESRKLLMASHLIAIKHLLR